MTEKKENFFKKAFREMAEDARAQHEVDKANFQAVKAESKANFEENRGTNTFRRAKENTRQSWQDAKMTPDQRREKVRKEQEAQIELAKVRTAAANEKYEQVKVKKSK